MVSRTLLQLLTLLIIYTKQIDARNLNKTKNVYNLKCIVNNTTENKCSVKDNESIRNDTALIKKTYADYDQQSDTNLESKYDVLTRNKYNLKSNHIDNEESDSGKSHGQQESDENIKVDTPAIVTPTRRELTSSNNRKHFSNEDKRSEHARHVNSNNGIIQESELELDPNDGLTSQNDAEKNSPTVQRHKLILTGRRHKKKIRTTQAMTDRWTTDVDDKEIEMISKTKHCDCKNYKSIEKLSRDDDIYILKPRDETKPESKHAKYRHSKSFRTFKRLPIPDKVSKSKHSDHIDTISKENEIYKLEHLKVTESIEPIKQQVKKLYYKPFSHDFQRNKHRDNTVKQVIDKVKYIHTSKNKHDFDKIKSKKDKNKPTLNGNRDTHTDVRYGECSNSSEDTFNAAEADTHEQETLDSTEDQLNDNDSNQPRLPFYISSTTPKYLHKHTNKQDMLLNHLNTILKGSSDINETIDRLASSKILDFITARVADHMLKNLQKSQAFKNLNNFTTTHEEAKKVEHIDILFKNDGEMIMMNREKVKENKEIPNFTLFPGRRGK